LRKKKTQEIIMAKRKKIMQIFSKEKSHLNNEELSIEEMK